MKIANQTFLLVVTAVVFFSTKVHAQAVNEPVENSIYEYLYRHAQKGNIELNDMVRPLFRGQIAEYLSLIAKRADSFPSSINRIEKKELRFYQQEYGKPLQESFINAHSEKWFGKDVRGRLRFFSKIAGDPAVSTGKAKMSQPFQFNIEPLLQGEFQLAGKTENITRRAVGAQAWASLGKRWGFQLYFKDVTEDGVGLDQTRQFTPANGLVLATTPKTNSLNFSDVRASVNYKWNSGQLVIGKEQYLVGYGLNGNLIHSVKAPTYPYVRLQQRILPWLQFEYLHGILHSGLIDTANSYRTQNLGVYGGQRFKMIPKYFITHSLNMRLAKGLHVAVGESVIYSDRLQPGYWMPIILFKAWDQYIAGNNINAGANTQIFLQASSRNQIPYTHVYGSLFIDEIRLTEILNPAKSRNQFGFNVGASITDLPFFPYWTFNFDYSRINPFVYQNLHPAQEYTNNGFLMGDWMGSNADRYIVEIKYTPLPRLRLSFRQERIRKGGKGTVEQQYFASPQPRFLHDLQFKQWTTTARASYEWKNNLYFHLQFQRQDRFMYTGTFQKLLVDRLNAGFSIGL
jgi:hypothetical protein